jgi:hypothetical protein
MVMVSVVTWEAGLEVQSSKTLVCRSLTRKGITEVFKSVGIHRTCKEVKVKI